MFNREKFHKKVKNLSDGERKRLHHWSSKA
jgi:ATPase subunit of ABC transporter with duplicated ATPase domains